MALTKCPECNKEISDTSKQCIHCGYNLKKKNKVLEYIMPLVIILFVAIIGFYISTSLLNKQVFKQTIEDKYGEDVKHSCRKYMENANDSTKFLYNCQVTKNYNTSSICLECTNNQFLFFTRLSECTIKIESNCAWLR